MPLVFVQRKKRTVFPRLCFLLLIASCVICGFTREVDGLNVFIPIVIALFVLLNMYNLVGWMISKICPSNEVVGTGGPATANAAATTNNVIHVTVAAPVTTPPTSPVNQAQQPGFQAQQPPLQPGFQAQQPLLQPGFQAQQPGYQFQPAQQPVGQGLPGMYAPNPMMAQQPPTVPFQGQVNQGAAYTQPGFNPSAPPTQ